MRTLFSLYILIACNTQITAQKHEAAAQVALYGRIITGLRFQQNAADITLHCQLSGMLQQTGSAASSPIGWLYKQIGDPQSLRPILHADF